MSTAFLLKSSVSASVHRGVIRRRSQQGEGLLMKGCVATAFLFVGLMIFGFL